MFLNPGILNDFLEVQTHKVCIYILLLAVNNEGICKINCKSTQGQLMNNQVTSGENEKFT